MEEFTGTQIWPMLWHGTRAFRDHLKMPYDLFCAVNDGHEVEAHGMAFERSIWENICVPDFGWLLPEPKQWRDTMAVACYYALPPALDKLSRVLGFEGKNPEGTRLISRYSKLHLKTAKDDIPPEDFDKFVQYCNDDVDQEAKVSDFLGDLPEQELEVFFLDQEINRRGLYLDVDSINDAMDIVTKRSKKLAQDFYDITGVWPSQNDKARIWFQEEGYPMENLQADYIEEVMEGKHDFTIQGPARTALDLRKQYNRASTKKLNAMVRNRAKDGRARFQTRYHGAFTGRWTGLGIQPLNLMHSFEEVPAQRLVDDLKHRDDHWLDVMYGDAMEAVGRATRHHIRAEKGKKLIAGDFTSIEAIALSCLSYEKWKIDAFHRGDPIYELMGCKIHKLGDKAVAFAKENKAAFKKKYPDERFDGKTGELAFGFQGALGAWRQFDPEKSSKHSDERVKEICYDWRNEHPATVAWWRALERAAIKAVKRNELVEVWTEYMPDDHTVLAFEPVDEWLSMLLPNGKRIWYWQPEIRLTMPPWHKPDSDEEQYEDCRLGACDCEPRHQLTYMAWKEGQWKRVYTYGGKFAENATQSVSREILVPAMLRIQEAGYDIILDVYDEIVAEVLLSFGSKEEFRDLMVIKEDWFDWWPISVDVWEGDRYKK